jgi:hypothetical protein
VSSGCRYQKWSGGAEIDEETILQAIEDLLRQDGSVGWNVMIASNAATAAAYLPVAALREVYRDSPDTVIAGALLPQGAAIPMPGLEQRTAHLLHLIP